MDIKPLTPALGAEVTGADLKDPAQHADIHRAFADHGLLVIRGQSLTPEDQLRFARTFGEIDINRFFRPVDGHPEIAEVLKEPDQKEAIGENWHTDHSYDQEPAMGSILHAIEVPPIGGDTAFASMHAAYAGLSPTMQTFLRGLKAHHGSAHAFGAAAVEGTEAQKTGRYRNSDAATQDAIHPVVISHPLSGKPCLFVNPAFTTRIIGLTTTESDGLLRMLYAHASRPEYQARVRWRAGDVTMWDNRATWHVAINDYHGHRRLMHRVTVRGTALEAA